jgi:hypothetical protein
MQSVGSAIAVMAVISLFFLPDRVIGIQRFKTNLTLSAIRVRHVLLLDFHLNRCLWFPLLVGK